jgi:thiol:disulfide interchange protein
MAKNTNFLFALLAVVAIAWIALAARSCSAPRVPGFIDARLTLDEAQLRSRESGKPVFVLVAADWCPFCSSLKAGALADGRVASWLKENTEPVYVDVTRYKPQDPQAVEIFNRLNVDSIPAMILLRSGKQVGHIEGDIPADDVLRWLEKSRGPAN